MSQTNTSIGAHSRSPFSGCVILILAMLVMVFLVVFSTWGLFRQYDEIVKFTDAKASPVPLASLDGQEAQLNALAEKLEKFRQDLTDREESRLALTPAEINLAIAAYDPLRELRQTFHITAIEGDTVKIAISFRLNGKPRLARKDEPGLTASDPRFLNAVLTARPQLLGREVVLQILDITVPGVTVPREFIEQMSPYRVTERYQTHSILGPAMARLTSVQTSDGAVRFHRLAGEKPADRITDSEVDSAGGRFFAVLGIAACVFLVVVGLLIFAGLRAKAAKG